MTGRDLKQPTYTGRPVIIMGVSGSGKTTVGTAVAQNLGVPFIDGDDFHPAVNKEKMAAGHALNDEDRFPWLLSIGAELSLAAGRGRPVVIACSALRRSYRDILRSAEPSTRFVYLKGNAHLIGQRMARRQHEFMPVSLLETQLETLEPPGADEAAIVLDIDQKASVIVEAVTAILKVGWCSRHMHDGLGFNWRATAHGTCGGSGPNPRTRI